MTDAGNGESDASIVTDGAVAGGDCSVVFSADTSNTLEPTLPITMGCTVNMFGGGGQPSQINFEASDTIDGTMRLFKVDWFDGERGAGAELDLADGYDFATMTGSHASYIELGATDSPLWVASEGTLTIESVSGNTYVLELSGLKLEADTSGPVPGTATGDFEVNGTITATLP